MLKLFALFHLNLMYSSIEQEQRPAVIARCYHPLLDLAGSGLPVALEAPGLTLELIRDLDPGWLDRLRGLLAGGGVTFVGSGYSQLIGPLAPAAVNRRNLQLGADAYDQLLRTVPQIWLVNEMTYSAGLPPLYREIGAAAIVTEWNNAHKVHPEWDRQLAFHRQQARGIDGRSLPVIWVDTLDFQQLQRRARDQITDQEFRDHWRRRADACRGDGFAAVYGSDAEVFDFRPGRFRDEGDPAPREWAALGAAIGDLTAAEGFAPAALPEVLAEPDGEFCGRTLRLETAGQPVIVKKQEKYNLNRWAATGRGDLEANTACHRIAAHLQDAREEDPRAWRRLCRLWSSDLRTHVTAARWERFLAETQDERGLRSPLLSGQTLPLPDPVPERLELATAHVAAVLDVRRGLALRAVRFGGQAAPAALGTLPHGYFEDIALGADFYTGHAVLQRPGNPKRTDLVPCGASLRLFKTAGGDLVAEAELVDDELRIRKQVVLGASEPRLELRGRMSLPARRPGEIHPIHLTVLPEFLDPRSLAFAACNGGDELEVFGLGDHEVHHGAAYSTLITAKGGLGATDGRVVLGDHRRRLVCRHDPCVAALVPTVRHVPAADGRYFLRVRYAAQEIDETFVADLQPWQTAWCLTVTLQEGGLLEKI